MLSNNITKTLILGCDFDPDGVFKDLERWINYLIKKESKYNVSISLGNTDKVDKNGKRILGRILLRTISATDITLENIYFTEIVTLIKNIRYYVMKEINFFATFYLDFTNHSTLKLLLKETNLLYTHIITDIGVVENFSYQGECKNIITGELFKTNLFPVIKTEMLVDLKNLLELNGKLYIQVLRPQIIMYPFSGRMNMLFPVYPDNVYPLCDLDKVSDEIKKNELYIKWYKENLLPALLNLEKLIGFYKILDSTQIPIPPYDINDKFKRSINSSKFLVTIKSLI